MLIKLIGRTAWGIEVIHHREIREGDVISLAIGRVRQEVRTLDAGKEWHTPNWQEPTNWAYQAGKAQRVVKIHSQQPGRLTIWSVEEDPNHKYAATSCVLRWHRLHPPLLHCECPLGGDKCCLCGTPECEELATMAVRHQVAQILEGR